MDDKDRDVEKIKEREKGRDSKEDFKIVKVSMCYRKWRDNLDESWFF